MIAPDEERGGPKPKPQGSLVKNPSVPGVQRPGNTPSGRDAPPPQEKRG
jgi:hypothetical protein